MHMHREAGSGRHRLPQIVAALTIVIAGAAAPALGGPGTPADSAVTCWSPGAAPALFSWPASPGIACRDLADGRTPTGSDAVTGATAARPGPAQTRPDTQITFSGSAYFGIAAAF